MSVRPVIGIAAAVMVATSIAAPASAQVDFSGQWAPLYHEDTIERIPGPELGDYTGLPLNDARRRFAPHWAADGGALYFDATTRRSAEREHCQPARRSCTCGRAPCCALRLVYDQQ